MLYKMFIVLIAFGLFGAMPVQADEDCDMILLNEEGVVQCELMAKSDHPKIERIEDEMYNDLIMYSAQEEEEMIVSTKEDNDILAELCKL